MSLLVNDNHAIGLIREMLKEINEKISNLADNRTIAESIKKIQKIILQEQQRTLLNLLEKLQKN